MQTPSNQRTSFQQKKRLTIINPSTPDDDDEQESEKELEEALEKITQKSSESSGHAHTSRANSKTNVFLTTLRSKENLLVPNVGFHQLIDDDYYQEKELPSPSNLANHFSNYFQNYFQNVSGDAKLTQTSFERLEKAQIFQMKKRGIFPSIQNNNTPQRKHANSSANSPVVNSPSPYSPVSSNHTYPVLSPQTSFSGTLESSYSNGDYFPDSPSKSKISDYFLVSPSPTKPTQATLATRLSDLPRKVLKTKSGSPVPEKSPFPRNHTFGGNLSNLSNNPPNISRSFSPDKKDCIKKSSSLHPIQNPFDDCENPKSIDHATPQKRPVAPTNNKKNGTISPENEANGTSLKRSRSLMAQDKLPSTYVSPPTPSAKNGLPQGIMMNSNQQNSPNLLNPPQNAFLANAPVLGGSTRSLNTIKSTRDDLMNEAVEICNFFGYHIRPNASLMDGEFNISNPFMDCLVFLEGVKAKVKENIKKVSAKLDVSEMQRKKFKEEAKHVISSSVERRFRIVRICETFLLKYPAETKYIQQYYEEITNHYEMIFGQKFDTRDFLKKLYVVCAFFREKIKILRKIGGISKHKGGSG